MGKSYHIQKNFAKNNGHNIRIPLSGTINKEKLIQLLN
jgi:hypothetical protein